MKKFLATSSMLTYMLLVNAGITSAQDIGTITVNDTVEQPRQSNVRHEAGFDKKVTVIANKLNLDPEELKQDAKKGKTIKQILKSRGIPNDKIQQVLGNKRSKR